jgi:membrane-bound lytic murein transglycosylase A
MMVGRSRSLHCVARLAVVAAALGACAPTSPPEDKLELAAISFAEVPGWDLDRQDEAVPAIERSCVAMVSRPDTADAGPMPVFGLVADWRAACAAIGGVPSGDAVAARSYLERWFKPYRASNRGRQGGFLTGYYEPELRGSRKADARYQIPLLLRPPDLVTVDLGEFRETLKGERIAGRIVDGRLRPYASRSAIVDGALAGRDLEFVWVDDAIDAFFLHIQGSGRVVLPDGSMIRVGYAAANGHAYTAIGRELVARGQIEREAVTMQSIRDWLAAHPAEASAVMGLNASFIFFRELPGDGPLGTQGVVLTPGRSLAVDTRFVSLGTPVWVDTVDPIAPESPLRRLMVAQDTGGAIRGPLRGDVFWGHGDAAAARAGRMQSEARLILLLPAALPARAN